MVNLITASYKQCAPAPPRRRRRRRFTVWGAFRTVPGVRRMDSEKYKGSFQMLKQLGMGDASLRARLHTRKVHKWAGKCFPDTCEFETKLVRSSSSAFVGSTSSLA